MRDVVVRVVRKREVADDVDQHVRRRACGRNGTGSQWKRGSQSQTHEFRV
jgi:hypothetical protein